MSARSDRRAHQPWVREVQQLKRRGVVNQGDDVTVVVLPRRRVVGAFRQSVRMLGLAGFITGLLAGIAGVQWIVLLFMLLLPAVLVLFFYVLLKEGLMAALGLVLVSPVALVLAFFVASAIMLMREFS